jgi:hypothetical protein
VTAAPLALAVALAAPADLRLEAGVSSTGLARTTAQAGLPATSRAEALVTPWVAAALPGPDLGLAVAYRPILSDADVLSRRSLDVLHAGEARAQLRLAPPWRLSAAGNVARGTTDLLAEARRTPGELQTIPTTQLVSYRADRADLRLEGGLDPRTALEASAGWFLDGGEGPASRALVPVEEGLRARAGVRWNATPIDVLDGRAEGTRVQLLGLTDTLAEATAGWRRRVAPPLDAWARAGAIATLQRAPSGATRRGLLPALELGAGDGDPRRPLALLVVARAGAAVDRSTGYVGRQLEALGTARWRLAPLWTLSSRAGVSLIRLAAGDVRRVSAESRIEWRATPHLAVGAGLFGDWQLAAGPALPPIAEGGVLVALSADTVARGPGEARAH